MTDSITNARTASNSVTNAVTGDRQDGEGSGSLLGLEPTHTENTRQNPVIDEDSNLQPASEPRLAPLLGTRGLSGNVREGPASSWFTAYFQ
jgi:hypothetical protein